VASAETKKWRWDPSSVSGREAGAQVESFKTIRLHHAQQHKVNHQQEHEQQHPERHSHHPQPLHGRKPQVSAVDLSSLQPLGNRELSLPRHGAHAGAHGVGEERRRGGGGGGYGRASPPAGVRERSRRGAVSPEVSRQGQDVSQSNAAHPSAAFFESAAPGAGQHYDPHEDPNEDFHFHADRGNPLSRDTAAGPRRLRLQHLMHERTVSLRRTLYRPSIAHVPPVVYIERIFNTRIIEDEEETEKG